MQPIMADNMEKRSINQNQIINDTGDRINRQGY